MREQLEKLQIAYDKIVENQIGRLEPDLSADDFIAKYSEAVSVRNRLRDETNMLIETYLNPLLEENASLTDEDETQLYETAQKLSSYKQRTDPALAYRIYRKLLSTARSNNNEAKILKYLYWCGISLFYMVYHTTEHHFDELITAYFEEGADFYRKYDTFDDPETRQYIHRCLGNKSMMYYRVHGHEKAVESEEAAFTFWNMLMFRGKDKDFPWLSYFMSCYTHRHNNFFRKVSHNIVHIGEVAKEEANELLGIAMTINKLYHKNRDLYDVFGGSRYDFLLWRAQFFAGLISFDHLCENVAKLSAQFDEDDYSIDCLYMKINVSEHLITYAAKLKILKDKKDEFIPGALEDLLRRLSSLPMSVSPTTVSDLLQDFVKYISQFLELSEQIDVIYKLTSRRHIQSYAHGTMTGRLSSLITRRLIDTDPGQFAGCLGIKSPDDAVARAGQLCQFANTAGMCHDIGMISFATNPIMTARVLTDEEFKIVGDHPEIGAKFLKRDDDTDLSRGYNDVVLGHHRHFDNKGGYPEDFDIDSSDVKIMINIVSVANVLDTLTDNISLQPAEAMSVQDAIKEIISRSGKEFSPVITKLFEDSSFAGEIEDALNTQRRDIYYAAYKHAWEY